VDSLQGRLLVASPHLRDPNFQRTVVLLGEHNEDGAMGLVLNRPSDLTVGEAAPPLAPLVDEDDVVFVGGPVEQQAIVALAEFVEPERAGVLVLDAIGFLPSSVDDPAELGTLAACRVYAGYAGWSGGQLEAELEEGSWIVAEPERDDLFNTSPDRLWGAVLRRRGGADVIYALFPLDPRMN
jgi:putative transcriptional regulator